MLPTLPPPDSRLRRLLRLGVYVAPLGLATLLGVPICPTALVLRQPCPGCGISRASAALAHGDLTGAMTLNPIAPVVVPLAAGLALYGMTAYVFSGQSRLNDRVPMTLGIALSAALTVVWVMRWFGAFGGPVPV